MRIGILETGRVEAGLAARHGDYPTQFMRLLDGRGFDFAVWRALDGEMPAGPEACDGWLIPGSPAGAYEAHAWIPPLEDFIRAAEAAGRPMAGICFGHQIMAQALGGRVEKAEQGWQLGRKDYDGAGGAFSLMAFHQDQVVAVPEGASVTASAPACTVAALRFGDWGVSWQGHPEFTPEYFDALAAERAGHVFPVDFADAARAGVTGLLDGPRIGREIGDFFLSHGR